MAVSQGVSVNRERTGRNGAGERMAVLSSFLAGPFFQALPHALCSAPRPFRIIGFPIEPLLDLLHDHAR